MGCMGPVRPVGLKGPMMALWVDRWAEDYRVDGRAGRRTGRRTQTHRWTAINRWSSKGSLILLLKLLICLVYGIWEDLTAWKIILPGMVVICQHFWKLFKK